jgi:hypothetical protein
VRLLVNFVLATLGLTLICAGGRAADAYDPSSVTYDGETYDITSSERGDAVIYDISTDGHSVGSIGGSTDTMCDRPYLRHYDDDLVVYDCGRFDAYTMQDRQIVGATYPGESPWAREIRLRGLRLDVLGLALLVFVTGRFVASRRAAHAAAA